MNPAACSCNFSQNPSKSVTLGRREELLVFRQLIHLMGSSIINNRTISTKVTGPLVLISHRTTAAATTTTICGGGGGSSSSIKKGKELPILVHLIVSIFLHSLALRTTNTISTKKWKGSLILIHMIRSCSSLLLLNHTTKGPRSRYSLLPRQPLRMLSRSRPQLPFHIPLHRINRHIHPPHIQIPISPHAIGVQSCRHGPHPLRSVVRLDLGWSCEFAGVLGCSSGRVTT